MRSSIKTKIQPNEHLTLPGKSIGTLAFYTVYRLLLNRLTFFGLNRRYLLTTMVLSFIIPVLHFNVTRQASAAGDVMTEEHITTGITTIAAAIDKPSAITTTWTAPEILLYAYLAIAILLGVRLSFSIIKLIVLARNQGVGQDQFTLVKHASALHNSSFFNIIFLKNDLDATDEDVVITHEKEHIKRLHSLDIMLMEIAKVVLWFNPVPYMYRKSVEQIHEFEVDAAVTNQYNPKAYAGMLLKLSGFNAPTLVNNFSGSQLNKRVNMLFATRSKQIKKSLYVLIAPVVAALTWYLCVDHVYAQNILPNSGAFTVVIDAGHGGKNTGAKGNGYAEKDMALAIAKAVKKAGDANGIDVVLTRTDDEDVSIDDRVSKKADLLISLHINAVSFKKDSHFNGILAITDDRVDNPLSTVLAKTCLNELSKLKGISTLTDLKQQRIMLLKKATSPAVLLELGFLTNVKDARYITNPDKQTEIANAIINGIRQYQAEAK